MINNNKSEWTDVLVLYAQHMRHHTYERNAMHNHLVHLHTRIHANLKIFTPREREWETCTRIRRSEMDIIFNSQQFCSKCVLFVVVVVSFDASVVVILPFLLLLLIIFFLFSLVFTSLPFEREKKIHKTRWLICHFKICRRSIDLKFTFAFFVRQNINLLHNFSSNIYIDTYFIYTTVLTRVQIAATVVFKEITKIGLHQWKYVCFCLFVCLLLFVLVVFWFLFCFSI